MKRPSRFGDSPVVEEVRRARAALWKEGGGTLEGYLALMDQKVAELKAEGKLTLRYRQAPKPRSNRRAS
jgi:hypothetical protein